MRPTYYRGCWHVVSRRLFEGYTHPKACSPTKAVYNPKAVIPHAASLRQASAHCAIFPTAASRRSLGRISVPMWPVALSGRLPVEALVGHHPTNKLIGRDPIPRRSDAFPRSHALTRNIRHYHPFPGAIPEHGAGWSRITHPFATLTPAASCQGSRSTCMC